MTEFNTLQNELTHASLADGSFNNVLFASGRVTLQRSGLCCCYQFNISHTSRSRFFISAQPLSEIRLVYVSKGQAIKIGCGGGVKHFSVGESNCCLVKAGCEQEIVFLDSGECELFMLVIGLSEVSLLIGDSEKNLDEFLNGNECKWLLGNRNMPLGVRKAAIIRQLQYEKKPIHLKAAYSQVKLTELLILFLEKAISFINREAALDLRPEELAYVQKVQQMLDEYPAREYSLMGLARYAGTNEASLKKNFKIAYGTTIFAYLTARRMEYAKSLLLKGNLKVAMVAQEVGYKYASHFSMVFRKYHGYLPTKIMRIFLLSGSYLSELGQAVYFPI